MLPKLTVSCFRDATVQIHRQAPSAHQVCSTPRFVWAFVHLKASARLLDSKFLADSRIEGEGMQSQIVCGGCRTILLYPRGATNVCCSLCSTITPVSHPVAPPVPSPATDMAHLICGGCRTLLMYTRGAASVRCSCCHTVNLAPGTGFAHVSCGNCRTTLMYPSGAPSVKCALCQFVTHVNMGNIRVPLPMHGHSGVPSSVPASSSTGFSHPPNQTVVVENPMSIDKSGKLVSNVVVGVTMEKK